MEITPVFSCITCGTELIDGPEASPKPHWCDKCWDYQDPAKIEATMHWRRMPREERLREIVRLGNNVGDFYHVDPSDIAEMLSFRDSLDAKVVKLGNVAPDKRALISLAQGLTDSGALSEMIDNALDCAQRKRGGAKVDVAIKMDVSQGALIVTDNAGGMKAEELVRCLTLGSASPDGHVTNVIGRFGVGAKEAIYHFGREVTITTRDLVSDGLRTFLPSTWLEAPEWDLTIREAQAEVGSSRFEIGVLDRFDLQLDVIERELYEKYQKRIERDRLAITIDGKSLRKTNEPTLLYPPELYPRKYNFWINDVMVDLNVAMLSDEPGAAGIFFYASGRRFAHWSWTNPLAKTLFERPPQHRLSSHFRIEIDFQGSIDDIPINANKDEVDINKSVYRILNKIVSKIATPYLSIVSWLSQETNMGYLQKHFAGIAKKHISITSDSLGFVTPAQLGKVYELMSLPKAKLADPKVLIATLKSEREASETSGDTPTVTEPAKSSGGSSREIAAQGSGPSSGPFPEPEVTASLPIPDTMARPFPALTQRPSVIKVSLFTTELAAIEKFKLQIGLAADSLGVEYHVD